MKKRVLSLLMAFVMAVGLLPMSAMATGDNAVTVGFTMVDAINGEIEIMRKELTVEPGLAKQYLDGDYGGSVEMSTEVGADDVTPIDVLVAAHIDEYGKDFTDNTAENYISGFDYVTKVFGEATDITYTANGLMPNQNGTGYAINQYIAQDGDEISFYRIDWMASPANVCASFDKTEVEAAVGEELTLKLGFCSVMGYVDEPIAAANAEIYALNEYGTIGDKLTNTDEDGNFTVSFETAGTYYLTCKGEVAYYDEMWMTDSTGALSPAYCKVTVKEVTPPVVDVTEVTLDEETLSLEVGGTDTLTATVKPNDATDKTVTWTSSKEEVATVDSTGKVTAVAAGEATITAKAGEKSATCAVTVETPAANPNEIDATIGGTRYSPSNVAYIDKITIGDSVSVQEATFDGLTANIVLAPGTAPDATVDFAFSYVHMMPNNASFDIAFDTSSDADEEGKGAVTLDGGSGSALVTVIATMPHGKQNMTWTLNFSTASGGSSGGNKNMIPVEIAGNLWDDIYIGIEQFMFKDCKVLDYNWADESTLNVLVSDATADDGTLSIMYTTRYADGTDIDIPTPYTAQLTNGRATVKYNITPKGAYDRPEHADAAHTIMVNITNKGLTFPTLANGVAAEVDAAVDLGETFTVSLNSIFADAESDPMTYSVNIDGEGTVAADAQYSYTAPMVGEYELVFKAHDGMNWSTETYTVNLAVTDTEEAYTFTAKVPDAITPTFSATKGFREDGTDWAGSALTATKGESTNGWTSYTVTVPGSVDWVSVRGTDGTNDWGGMAFLAEQDAVITLRQVEAVINSKVVINGEQFFPTAEQAVFKVEYADEISTRYAVSGDSFYDDEYAELPYLGYRFLLVAYDNDKTYTYYAEPQADLTKDYATNIGTVKTVTTDSAAVILETLPLAAASKFTITAPKDAEVRVFNQAGGNYYGGYEIPVYEEKDNNDGTVTYTFSGTNTNVASYRVSMEGEITKAGYIGASDEDITVNWDGDDRGPAYTREYEFNENSYYYRADDSMVVNVNYRNNLMLEVGETHTLRSYRIWQIINNDTMNVMIEPDFHIREIANDGVISLSPYAGYHGNATGNRMDITALKAGTAILEVTYDAIEIMERTVGSGEIGGIGGLTFNACDPNRTALIVVQVGTEETDINFGILNNGGNVWDAECDTVYFLEEKGEISFEPTVGNGSISKVEVSGDKGASWTELTGVNGEYTAEILPGNNIIRITKADGAVSYQLVRGEQITYTVAERTEVSGQQTADGDGIIEAGEAIMISIHGGHVPFGKMAGISNPWTFHTKYNFNGTETKSGSGMYQYAHVNQVYLTIPEDAKPGDELSLTDGYTMVHTLFGSGGGAYRDAGDVVPPNLNAPDNISGAFNIFPDLSITVGGEADTVPVESVTLDKSTAAIAVAGNVTLTATVNPSNATENTVVWTSSDESVAQVANGLVKGLSDGIATITATAGGKSASCVVTVGNGGNQGGDTGGDNPGGNTPGDDDEDELEFGLAKDEIVGYVTVSFEDNGIRKSSELSGMEAKFRSPLGTIIAPTEVPFKAYDTIASVTLRLLDAMDFTASHDGNEFSNFYLSAIGGFTHKGTYYNSFGEFDAGTGSGWMITWDDWFINKGASDFTVKNGDQIRWQYTCQLGADIGDDGSAVGGGNQTPQIPPEVLPEEPTGDTPYTDVTGHWAEDAITFVYEKGLMTGTREDAFSPETELSRAMLVTILYRLEGEPAVTADNTFSDVKAGTWYTNAVIWASQNGIVNGVGQDRFAPDQDITREQMAAMLLRYSDYKDYDTTQRNDLSGYADADSISTWALEALQWANGEGLITGRKADLLVPQGDTTRAETATILMRYLETIA